MRRGSGSRLETLAVRGVPKAERERLRKLVTLAESASKVTPADTAQADKDDAAYLADLIALRAWFEDRSEIARAAVKRKDYLIRLGLASRKKPAKPATPAT